MIGTLIIALDWQKNNKYIMKVRALTKKSMPVVFSSEQWHLCHLSAYSGGTAPDLHWIPLLLCLVF